MRRPLLALAGAGLMVALCATLGLGQFLSALERAKPLRLLAFMAVGLTAFAVYALRWRMILAALGAPGVPLPILLLARMSGHAAGILLPSAHLSGAAVRTALLRRRGIEWTPIVVGIAVDRFIETTTSAIVGPIYLLSFLAATGAPPRAALGTAVLLGFGLLGITLAWIHLQRVDRLLPFLTRHGLLPDPFEGSETPGQVKGFLQSRSVVAALALSFLIEGLLLTELSTLAWSFGISLSPGVVCGVLLGIGLSHLAPIPGSLGSLEAAQVGVIRLAGGAADLGLAVGLIVRLRETLWTLTGLAWAYAEGVRPGATIAANPSRIDVNP